MPRPVVRAPVVRQKPNVVFKKPPVVIQKRPVVAAEVRAEAAGDHQAADHQG